MDNKVSKRIKYIDVLKAFTIFLVLWGHSIFHFSSYRSNNWVYDFIYSFHMPLFMMLSGYFAYSSLKLKPVDFIKKKFIQLLLPCLTWGLLIWITYRSGIYKGEFHLNTLFRGWLGLIYNFWFLKSCFICFILSYLAYQCHRYKLLILIILTIICLFINRFNIYLMFPSFIVGLFLKERTDLLHYVYQHQLFFWIIFLGLFISKPYIFHSVQNMSEVIPSGYYSTMIPFILNRLYRIIEGIIGALSFISLFHLLFNNKDNIYINRCSDWGKYTLGIYILQAIIIETILTNYIELSHFNISIVNFILTPLISAVVFFICIFIIKTIYHSKLLGLLFFGKQYN